MTASPYDDALSAIREHAENLAVALAIWEGRRELDAHARRCANDAMDAIDAALADLHRIRQRLFSEIRASDDATAARADALLERLRLISDDRRHHLAAVRRAARLGSRGPGGVLLTVTRRGRTAWVPVVIGPDGRTRWRGKPCSTGLEAQAKCSSAVLVALTQGGGGRLCFARRLP